ncbi:MAG: acyl-CoA dehydrogenase family protein [Nakamurella sp.]
MNNQVPPLADYDISAADPALRSALTSAGCTLSPAGTELAKDAGSAEIIEAARLADGHPPVLRTHDRAGTRIDEVEYHPAWHTLMDRAVRAGLQAAPWAPDAAPDAHLQRAAGFYLWTQTESGHLCPISMTYSAVPALRHSPLLTAQFEAGLRSRTYDFGLRPAAVKHGLLAGMSMTDKQGGSDLRQIITTAAPVRPSPADGAEYRLTGHKWFTSAPMNDVFLTLALAPGGLSCLLVPRVLPDGSRNGITLLRLKDKLGNRSNASAEIEYNDAIGWRVGDEGRGLATMLEMVTMTRLDCVLGSAGQMRAAMSQAAFYASRRLAFGHLLIGQSAMTAVLADLAIESWAATATAIRLADLVQTHQSGGESTAATLLRLALPVAKFWVCKRAVPVIAEALECLGGNGYVETFPLARLLRESPLNGIWEGSGTVTALDALRAVQRSPASGEALLAELGAATGIIASFDRGVRELADLLHHPLEPVAARAFSSLAGRLFAAALLIRQAPHVVADLYCQTRLAAPGDRVFGELPAASDADLRRLVVSITPEIS